MENSDNESTRVSTKTERTKAAEDKTVVQPTGDSRAVTDVMGAPTRFAISSVKKKKPHRILEPGMLIKDRFRLESEIGRGGMGVVYTARDLRKEEVGDQDSIIAIKLLTQRLENHPEALRMLQQEAKKCQGLAHPNVVTVYDFDRDDDTFYMTMEYLTGQNLEDYIKEHKNNPDDLETVLPIIQGIVEGLSYAHKKSIIHSDLKPANVYLTTAGTTKILDFGIARAMMESELERPANDVGRSKHKNTEELAGLTPNFASPEMFAGEPPRPGDDIYALACITYYLLTGRHPYDRTPADKAVEKRLVAKRIDGLNDRQWNTLLSGLELDGTKRISKADEFLAGFLPKKKEKWRLAAFVSLLATLVVFAYFSFRPTPEFDLFTEPPPEAPLSESLREQVETSLELAEVHMLVGRLISPPGSNALDKYNEVLEMHAYNRKAISGLKNVLDTLARQAEEAIDAGDFEDASALINTGLGVYAKHKKLLVLKSRLEAAQ